MASSTKSQTSMAKITFLISVTAMSRFVMLLELPSYSILQTFLEVLIPLKLIQRTASLADVALNPAQPVPLNSVKNFALKKDQSNIHKPHFQTNSTGEDMLGMKITAILQDITHILQALLHVKQHALPTLQSKAI